MLSFKYKLDEGTKQYYPRIPIVISSGTRNIAAAALLDSGSTGILIPKDISEYLGLEIEKTEKSSVVGGTKVETGITAATIIIGKGSETYRHRLRVSVLMKGGSDLDILLGREFFQFYDITFKEKSKEVILKKI